MTDECFDINGNALGFFVKGVPSDSSIPEELKAGICVAAEYADAERIAGLRGFPAGWG